MRRFLLIVVTALAAALLALVQFGGPRLGLRVPFSQVIAMRLPIALGGAALTLLLAAAAIPRRRRVTALACALLVAVLAGANLVTLSGRGLGTMTPEAAAAAPTPAGALRIVSWNTTSTGVSVDEIAQLAVHLDADVLALPETRPTRAAQVASRMRELGRPMRVVPSSSDDSRFTMSLLVAQRLSYDIEAADSSEEHAGGIRGGILASSGTAGMPGIAVVHAQQPGLNGSQAEIWREHLDWVRTLCDSGRQLLVLGDFNATPDNLGDTPGCRSAAQQTSAAGATGTWPTSLPWWAGASIDHVLTTSGWRADSFGVLSGHDGSGSDHRPVFAVVTAV